MQEVIIVIHLLLAISIVILVLLQRSEGGALGMGGGGGAGGGFLTGREASNILTRATAVLAGAFMVTSIVLTVLANPGGGKAIVTEVETPAPTAPAKSDSQSPSVPVSN